MKNPNSVNLQTSADIREAGWQAECRDADGHLCRTHVPFENDEEIVWLGPHRNSEPQYTTISRPECSRGSSCGERQVFVG
jgi:hypothetical protein